MEFTDFTAEVEGEGKKESDSPPQRKKKIEPIRETGELRGGEWR